MFALTIPPEVWLSLGTFAAGLVIATAAGFGRRLSARIRGDGDPSNDWEADLIDAAIEAHGEGKHDEVGAALAALSVIAKAKAAKKPAGPP